MQLLAYLKCLWQLDKKFKWACQWNYTHDLPIHLISQFSAIFTYKWITFALTTKTKEIIHLDCYLEKSVGINILIILSDCMRNDDYKKCV